MVKQSFALSAGKRIDAAISYLPGGMRREILEIARSVLGFERRLSEIRIRRGGVSMLVVGGVSYPLIYRISDDEMRALVDELSGGAMYAHRDTVARGYIVASGMRIGISGLARYDGGEVGVGEFRSVVFRLQCAECNFAGDLDREWQESGGGNLLIAAPPLGGKGGKSRPRL